jgi:hypothetical protein
VIFCRAILAPVTGGCLPGRHRGSAESPRGWVDSSADVTVIVSLDPGGDCEIRRNAHLSLPIHAHGVLPLHEQIARPATPGQAEIVAS